MDVKHELFAAYLRAVLSYAKRTANNLCASHVSGGPFNRSDIFAAQNVKEASQHGSVLHLTDHTHLAMRLLDTGRQNRHNIGANPIAPTVTATSPHSLAIMHSSALGTEKHLRNARDAPHTHSRQHIHTETDGHSSYIQTLPFQFTHSPQVSKPQHRLTTVHRRNVVFSCQ